MEIREIGREDLDDFKDLRVRAFGYKTTAEWQAWHRLVDPTLGTGRLLGGFDGTRMVATARIIDFGQWWYGSRISMGGVSGVAVAPEDRGRGAGRRLMTEVLARLGRLGHPISVLYPATTPLYRSLGWEHAGSLHEVTLDPDELRTIAPEPVKVRRPTPADAAEVGSTICRVHSAARDCGPVDWGAQAWRAFLSDPETFCYLADDGFLAYRWSGSTLKVSHLVAGSEATARGLWSIVGSGSSVAKTVRARLAPNDPALWLLRERALYEPVERGQWMLRLADVRKAIELRGFPVAVSAGVPLVLADRQVAANSGSWWLQVADGQGRLEPAAESEDAVRLDIGAMSALYAGVSTATLRRAGRLTGAASNDPVLDSVFAATPFTLDFF